MKTNFKVVLLVLCSLTMLSAGCGKEQTATPSAAPESDSMPTAATTPAPPAGQPLKAIEATEVAVTENSADAAAQELARIQAMIDTAKNLVGEKQYAKALETLAEVSTLTLSPDQQTQVDGLRTVAEQEAAKAAGKNAAATAAQALGVGPNDKP